MNISPETIMLNPSIEQVPLLYKQNFENAEQIEGVQLTQSEDGKNGVSKITMKFDREEDMIVMSLSTFVHDYTHDYNLGSMHGRVINKNTELFKSLNIKIGLQYFKNFCYVFGGPPREVSLYDDNQYTDFYKSVNPGSFNFYFDSAEIPIQQLGGDLNSKSNLLKEQRIKIEEPIKIEERIKIEEPIKQGEIVEKLDIIQESGLFRPKVDNLTDQVYDTFIFAYENNADMIALHSQLNIFVATFLGCKIRKQYTGTANFYPDKKNQYALDGIMNSIDYIIFDFLVSSSEEMIMLGYSNLFLLLKCAFFYLLNKNKGTNKDPFTILNSPEMVLQFINNYVAYLFCDNIDEIVTQFNMPELKETKIDETIGGAGEDDPIIEESIVEEEVELKPKPKKVLKKKVKAQIQIPQPITEPNEPASYTTIYEPVDGFWTPTNKIYFNVAEYVFVTHNNLLTTLTRGIFIKLGIWQKLFGSDYIFDNAKINQISYDRLQQVYPFEENKNNELLVLEILILKRMLLEMSPVYTLIFGAKIDDDLKDYMDSFFYNYYVNKEKKIDEPQTILPEMAYNPDIEGENILEYIPTELDIIDEDERDEDDFNQVGGVKDRDIDGDIEMKTFVKPVIQEPIIQEPIIQEPIIQEPTIQEPIIQEPIIQEPTQLDLKPVFPKRVLLPVLLNKLKKMYQNNVSTVQNLKDSKISPVNHNGKTIDNLFELLEANETLITKDGTYKISAPKYKFIINNAVSITANINGMRLFIPMKTLQEIEEALQYVDSPEASIENLEKEYHEKMIQMDEINNRIKELSLNKSLAYSGERLMLLEEYDELEKLKIEQKNMLRTNITPIENKLFLLKEKQENPEFYDDFKKNYKKWFKVSQPFFGLYRSMNRGVFCPTSSMMDAMDNCSLKYNASEPKEIGTSNYELIYESPDGQKQISYSGVVLNYNKTFPNGNNRLCALLDFKLKCNGFFEQNDIAKISTSDIEVVESNDLKARVAYVCVIERIKELYDENYSEEQEERILEIMWNNMQINNNLNNFNRLLGATAIKTMGDFLQECQACFKWGGYISNLNSVSDEVKSLIQDKGIKPIYRSVNKDNSIIPYDNKGNGLRMGIQGDRPSGFRSIYMLLNGKTGVNDQAITGYVYTCATQNPSRTLLVSRNEGIINSNGLSGSVIYVTRELQRPDNISFLKTLEYVTKKLKSSIMGKASSELRQIRDNIISSSVEGSVEDSVELIGLPRGTKQELFKNILYNDWLDYNKPYSVNEVANKKMKEIQTIDVVEEVPPAEEEMSELNLVQKAKVQGFVEKKSSESERLNNKIEDIQSTIQFYKDQTEKIGEIDMLVQQKLEELEKIPEYKSLKEQIVNTKRSSKKGSKNIIEEHTTLLYTIDTLQQLINQLESKLPGLNEKMKKKLDKAKTDIEKRKIELKSIEEEPMFKLNSLKPQELKDNEKLLEELTRKLNSLPILEEELTQLLQQREEKNNSEEKEQIELASASSASASATATATAISSSDEQIGGKNKTKMNKKINKQYKTKKNTNFNKSKLTKKQKKIHYHKTTIRNKKL